MLNLQSVSKSFSNGRGSLQALKDLSLEVEKGEFVAIVGPSGCGKTTLLKIVAGLLEPSDGRVRFESSCPEIGFVFQKPNLLEWRTVEENVRLSLELQGKKGRNVESYLSLVGMSKFRHYFPGQLSGGMQQRVAIARALSSKPDVLLMDEPFSAIDDFGREELNIMLEKIWKKTGKTVLFVTHNIEEAVFLADRIVVLGERPAIVKEVLPVSLPRSRKPEIKHSQLFQGHVKWVKSVIAR